MTPSATPSLLHKVWEYPLFEALFGRRSRRFGLGLETTEGHRLHEVDLQLHI